MYCKIVKCKLGLVKLMPVLAKQVVSQKDTVSDTFSQRKFYM